MNCRLQKKSIKSIYYSQFHWWPYLLMSTIPIHYYVSCLPVYLHVIGVYMHPLKYLFDGQAPPNLCDVMWCDPALAGTTVLDSILLCKKMWLINDNDRTYLRTYMCIYRGLNVLLSILFYQIHGMESKRAFLCCYIYVFVLFASLDFIFVWLSVMTLLNAPFLCDALCLSFFFFICSHTTTTTTPPTTTTIVVHNNKPRYAIMIHAGWITGRPVINRRTMPHASWTWTNCTRCSTRRCTPFRNNKNKNNTKLGIVTGG